jgi:glycosyltransferase involved in cell wall biosynthesis
MKLLIYSHYFAPVVGGVETIVLSLAQGLVELRDAGGQPRFDVTLATQTPAGNLDDRSLPFPVVRRPSLGGLENLIRNVDVVHVAGPALAPLFLAWLARKPFVVEHHGHQAVCPNGILVHQPDRSICPGHFQAGHYGECVRCQATEVSWLRSAARTLLMFPRNAVSRRAACNIEVSQRASERHALPRSRVVYHGIADLNGKELFGVQPRAKLHFACVGRFVPEKGIPVLLEAAGILKGEGCEFDLLLIGDGPQRPQLEAIIERSGLSERVRITGFLQGTALDEAIAQVRVVVMPSVWEETAGLSAIEQMMRGRLVIASRISGLGEMVGDAGLTFLPGDAQDLARCMREVLKDPSKVEAIGSEARSRALSLFLRERMIADHAGIYAEVLHGSSS